MPNAQFDDFDLQLQCEEVYTDELADLLRDTDELVGVLEAARAWTGEVL